MDTYTRGSGLERNKSDLLKQVGTTEHSIGFPVLHFARPACQGCSKRAR